MATSFLVTSIVSLALTEGIAFFSSPREYQVNLFLLPLLSISIQWFVFLVHASGLFTGVRSEKYFDLTGSLTFLSLTVFCVSHYHNLSFRQRLLSLCVIAWCIRLGSFLFLRILKEGGIDSRFVEVKKNIFRFWGFWTIQGVWVFLTSLPVFIVNCQHDPSPDLNIKDLIGISLWCLGFVFECVSDYQKLKWKENLKTKDKFINTGLWKLSRHPNYFGEILLWIGVYLSASSSFTTFPQWICAALSPCFTAFLLVKLSGIPLLEKASDKKWGENKEYQQYKRDVPVLIPWVGRRGDAPF